MAAVSPSFPSRRRGPRRRSERSYQEYKLGTEKYGGWFDPPIRVKDGRMTVPVGPGVGIKDVAKLLKGAEEL